MKWLIKRLAEPSSWAGLGVLPVSIQQAVTAPNAVNIAAVIFGIAAVLVPEQLRDALSKASVSGVK